MPKPLRVRIRTVDPHLQGFDTQVTLVDDEGNEYNIPVTAVRFDAAAGQELNTVTLMLAEADVDVLGDLAGFIIEKDTEQRRQLVSGARLRAKLEEDAHLNWDAMVKSYQADIEAKAQPSKSFDKYAARYERYGDLYKRHPKGAYYAYDEPQNP